MAISPSLNSAVVTKFAAIDPRKRERIPDPQLDDLAGAVDVLRAAAVEIDDLAGALRKDRTRTAEENAVRLRSATVKVAERAAARLDDAHGKTAAEIERLNAASYGPRGPRDQNEIAQEGELRALVRAMPKERRLSTVIKRIAEGNAGALLSAVLNATDPMLLGMSEIDQSAVRQSWRKRTFPAELARIERLTKASEAARRAGGAFVAHVARYTESQAVRLADANAQRAAEAVAAAGQN